MIEIGGMLTDECGSESRGSLQKLIDVVYR